MSDSIPIFEEGKEFKPYHYELVFNGKVVDTESGYITHKPVEYVWIYDQELYAQMLTYPIKSLVQNLRNIEFRFEFHLDTKFEEFCANTFA